MLSSVPQSPPFPIVSFHYSQLSMQHWLSHLTPSQLHFLLYLTGNDYEMKSCIVLYFCKIFSISCVGNFSLCMVSCCIFHDLTFPTLSTTSFISILLLCVHKPVALDGYIVLPGVCPPPHLTSPLPSVDPNTASSSPPPQAMLPWTSLYMCVPLWIGRKILWFIHPGAETLGQRIYGF